MAPTAKKPHQAHHRAHQDMDRSAFTQGVIRALMEKGQQPQPPPKALAQSALNSLQYDYPLVSVLELDALAAQLRDALQINKERQTLVTGITHQLVSNATASVLSANKTGQQHDKQHQQETSATNHQTLQTEMHATASISLLTSASTPSNTLAAAYQRLCTVLFLQFINTLLNVPLTETWQLLQGYNPSELLESNCNLLSQLNDSANTGNVPDQATDQLTAMMTLQQNGSASTTDEQLTTQRLLSQANGNNNNNRNSSHSDLVDVEMIIGVNSDDVEAEEQDDDDMAYEPLEEPIEYPQHSTAALGMVQPDKLYAKGNGVHYTSDPQPPYAADRLNQAAPQNDVLWQEVKRKLVHLCSQQHLSALAVPLTHPAMEPQHNTHSDANSNQNTPIHTPIHSVEKAVTAQTSSSRMQLSAKLVTNGLQATPSAGTSTTTTVVDSQPANHALINRTHMVWERPEVQECLFQLIRSLGVHSQASDLQPILRSYLSLVVEWCDHKPQILEHLLNQVWDSLGVSSIAGMPRGYRRNMRSRVSVSCNAQADQTVRILLPEADMCLAMVLQLVLKLPPNSQGRAAVWRCVHAHLLPVLKHCLSDIAAAEGSQDEAAAAAAAAALDATCKVLMFYIEDSPGGSRPAQTLQQTGILGALCAMFVTKATSPSAEQFSSVLLLCAASSSITKDWMLAVPGFRQTVISSPELIIGGKLQHHGLLWHALLSQPTNTVPSNVLQQDSGNRDQQMVALIQGATSDNITQVQASYDCLQLMSSVSGVCRGGLRWSKTVQDGMQDTFSQLKQRTSASGTVNTSMTSKTTQLDALHEGHGLVPLDELKLKQLHTACAASLKLLLTDGSKAD